LRTAETSVESMCRDAVLMASKATLKQSIEIIIQIISCIVANYSVVTTKRTATAPKNQGTSKIIPQGSAPH
jgi:hypothetical protein